jgi:hypothetical protein
MPHGLQLLCFSLHRRVYWEPVTVRSQESIQAATATSVPAAMAEWLRRWTRNPMGYSRAGSNPVRSGLLLTIVMNYF